MKRSKPGLVIELTPDEIREVLRTAHGCVIENITEETKFPIMTGGVKEGQPKTYYEYVVKVGDDLYSFWTSCIDEDTYGCESELAHKVKVSGGSKKELVYVG